MVEMSTTMAAAAVVPLISLIASQMVEMKAIKDAAAVLELVGAVAQVQILRIMGLVADRLALQVVLKRAQELAFLLNILLQEQIGRQV
jgi:hypothetical protein